MKKILRFADTVNDWSGKFVSFALYIGIILLCYEVVARYIFNSPTVWAHGYSQRLYGSYFILIGGFTLLNDGHVRVDLIYNHLSLRWRALLDILNYSLLLIWAAFITREGFFFFLTSWRYRETDEMSLAHPVYPVKFLLFVGMLLILIQGINKMIVSLLTFFRGANYEY
ncbi:MAG: TRAP transporter small permease subunit [Desulfosalsimonas sp.]